MVYVQDIEGKPIMPTTRHGKVRRLLKTKQAVVASLCPFTIRLTYIWLRKTESSKPRKYFTGGKPGRGRGVADIGRNCETSNYIGINWYIVTYMETLDYIFKFPGGMIHHLSVKIGFRRVLSHFF